MTGWRIGWMVLPPDLVRPVGMLVEAGVALSPGVDFDRGRGNWFLRFSDSGPEADMREAAVRMPNWRQAASGRRRTRYTAAEGRAINPGHPRPTRCPAEIRTPLLAHDRRYTKTSGVNDVTVPEPVAS
jgi:hypothetical protein